MATDFGYDLSCVSDLDPSGKTVSGRRLLAEAIVRRLTTPRGRLIDDANYGFDLTGYLNADVVPRDTAEVKALAEAECLKDERVVSANVTSQVNTGGVLVVTILIQDAAGPFPLVLSIAGVTATLLSANL